jgi:hypothetical protein
MWLNAWAGDNAGEVLGRQPYQALLAVTYTDADLPAALFQNGDLDGTTWYFNISATCLTPGSMSAIVTNVDYSAETYALELTPWQFSNTPTGEWQPGVHLFSISMLGANANVSCAIATVVVPPKSKVKRVVKLSDFAAQQVMGQRRAIHSR